MMSKIDDLLARHARLSSDIGQAEEWLEGMLEERNGIVAEIKAMLAKPSEAQLGFVGPPTPLPSQVLEASALEETAKIVGELGDNVTATMLATRLGLTQDAARLRLQRTEKKGLIRRVAFGRYAPKPQIPSKPVSLPANSVTTFAINGTSANLEEIKQ
jgi:hypothetical protein